MDEITIKSIADLERIKEAYDEKTASGRYQVLVCSGAGCVSSNCGQVRDAINAELHNLGIQDQVLLRETGCI